MAGSFLFVDRHFVVPSTSQSIKNMPTELRTTNALAPRIGNVCLSMCKIICSSFVPSKNMYSKYLGLRKCIYQKCIRHVLQNKGDILLSFQPFPSSWTEGFGTCNRLGHGLQLLHRFGDFQCLGQVSNIISSLNPKPPIWNGWKWEKNTCLMWFGVIQVKPIIWIWGVLSSRVLKCCLGKYLWTLILDGAVFNFAYTTLVPYCLFL